MMTVEQFYARKRKILETITPKFAESGVCLVVSKDNVNMGSKAGTICEVPLNLAAELMARDTHEIADSGQARAWREIQERERKKIAEAQLKRARDGFVAIMGGDLSQAPNVTLQPQASQEKK